MIIVSVTGPTMNDACRQIRASRRWADIFELRLDLIRDLELFPLLRRTRRPRIVTLRPAWEGGGFEGSEESRAALLREIAARGVEYIDVELRAGRDLIEQIRRVSRSVRIIVSHHGDAVPRSARESFQMFRHCGGDVLKWAYPATDSPDLRFAYDFLQMARRRKQKAIAVAMGEAGEPSRILYRVFGGWATYAAAEQGPAAAPGQVPASALVDIYRSPLLNGRTKVFGLLGNPVAQSKGMYLHNASFRRKGVNAVYVRFRTTDLEKFAKEVMPLIEGCSVTTPFKERVAMLVRKKDPGVRSCGAANTLYRIGKVWHAANSDAAAALDAIERKVLVKGKTLLILGAGGAARAIAYEGTKRGALVILANRNPERTAAVARDLWIRSIAWAEIGGVPYDILANATPVGMFPLMDDTPVPREWLRPRTVVFDAIYNPRETRLLREAKLAGARVIAGTEMFIRQAARQQELFLHRKADVGVLRRTVNKHL
jgi:3-dehydroquinate dehydratase/shikimate dehydrogenase